MPPMPQSNPMPATPPTEPDGDESMGGMDENELCVDLSALAMPDEQDQKQPPAVGDKVQAMIEGTVSRIEGDKAYVTMSAVNGQPVQDEDEAIEPSEPSESDDESDIRGMASQLPEGY